MRGKANQFYANGRERRITPAYAGKSDNAGDMYPQRRDHPRLCGEKSQRLMLHVKHTGSPPPMRGKATPK